MVAKMFSDWEIGISTDARSSVLRKRSSGSVAQSRLLRPTARTGETLEGLGEDAWTKEGDVNFLQDNWTASVTRITGRVSDADLLKMAELISSRLP